MRRFSLFTKIVSVVICELFLWTSLVFAQDPQGVLKTSSTQKPAYKNLFSKRKQNKVTKTQGHKVTSQVTKSPGHQVTSNNELNEQNQLKHTSNTSESLEEVNTAS